MENSLSSLSANQTRRLPPEILALIIELVAEEARYDSELLSDTNPTSARVTRRSWLICTHISRDWRSAGLQHAALWNHIPAVHKSLWELYALRARHLPLIITELPSDVVKWNRDVLTRELARARIFAYRGSPVALRRMVTILASASDLSILQNLSLTIEGLPVATLVLPSAILRKAALTLEHICLHNFAFLWSGLPPVLRVLELSGTLNEELDLIIEGLSLTPNLEILSIQGLQPRMEHLTERVELRRLRRYVLSGHVSSVATLCALIIPHPAASLDWSACTTIEEDDEYVVRMLEALSSSCAHSERPVCSEAKLEVYHSGLVELLLLPAREAFESTTSSISEKHGEIHVVIDDPYGEEHERARVLSRLYRTHWTKLEVTGGTDWETQQVIECFGQAKALEVLSLKDFNPNDAGSFFYTLNPDYMLFEGGSEDVYFPQLHTLSVSGINFGCSKDKCDDPDALGAVLDATLDFRKILGHKLSLLIVQSCSVAFLDVFDWSLDDKCTTVEWDNDEGEARDHYCDIESDEDEEDGGKDDDERSSDE